MKNSPHPSCNNYTKVGNSSNALTDPFDEIEHRRLGGAMSNISTALTRLPVDALRELFATIAAQIDLKLPQFTGSAGNKNEVTDWLLQSCELFRFAGQNGKNALDRRIRFVADLLKLSPVEHDIVAIAARRLLFGEWGAIFSALDYDRHLTRTEMQISVLTGHPKQTVIAALLPRNKLFRVGLITDVRHGDLDLAEWAQRLFREDIGTRAEIEKSLIPPERKTILQTNDFPAFSDKIDNASKLIEHSLNSGHPCNILLYGVPGTGKTEFAKLLAQAVNAKSVFIGMSDEYGGEPSPKERINHLQLIRCLTQTQQRNVLIIDEAEDLFAARILDHRSKLWLNHMVEEGRGAHIWIVNDARELGEVIVRRMDMAIHFDHLDRGARKKLINKLIVAEPTLDNVSEMASQLSAIPATPAIYKAAIRSAARVGGNSDLVSGLVEDMVRATGRQPDTEIILQAGDFDPALSRTNTNLEELADQLHDLETNRSSSRLRRGEGWSILLSGPSGTGKSAYAAYLAEKLGLDLIAVTGADLLGSYVGQTEQHITDTFRGAAKRPVLLLIDEVDGFLGDRREAQHNWELSMVNAMLTEMEKEQTRFIATTNLSDRLDPASARRFSLHIRYLTMTKEQSKLLFEKCFGIVAPPSLAYADGLTPGDFAQAKRRLRFTPDISPQTLVHWLSAASEARGNKGVMGFASAV